LRGLKKSASHFFSTTAPKSTSPLAPYSQASNTFIAASQPELASKAATMSIDVDLARQSSAKASAALRARMAATALAQDFQAHCNVLLGELGASLAE
jgi:hypothetical protein